MTEGEYVTFTGRVRNSGPLTVTDPFSDNFTYCWGVACAPAAMIGSHINKTVPMNIGATQNDTTASFLLGQSGIPRVQHYIDYAWSISESNETVGDNCTITDFTVVAPPSVT